MKTLVAVLAVVGVAVAGVGLAEANQCPLLIKQLKDGVAKVADANTRAQVEQLIAEAQKLHDQGRHADSVKKAEEAAKAAGITLQKRM
jgi:hypothetical protein